MEKYLTERQIVKQVYDKGLAVDSIISRGIGYTHIHFYKTLGVVSGTAEFTFSLFNTNKFTREKLNTELCVLANEC